MGIRTGRFRPADRLLRPRDFRRIGTRGERAADRQFVVLVAEGMPRSGQEATSRLGLTVSRRVGNAVVRNRVKRRVREWYRKARNEGLRGRDLVVIARASAGELRMEEVREQLCRLVRQALGGAGS